MRGQGRQRNRLYHSVDDPVARGGFIPVLFMSGMLGRLLRVAVTISLRSGLRVRFAELDADALQPLIKHAGAEATARFYVLIGRFFDSMLSGYDRSLQWVLRYAWLR